MKVLEVFSRYREKGGEETAVDTIRERLSLSHDVERLTFENESWVRPSVLAPLRGLQSVYNPHSAQRLREAIREDKPELLLFHNVFPVGSPSLYREAIHSGVPILHYIHNFRPFSVGATLYAGGRVREESLDGNLWGEVAYGAWQGSVVKSAVMALSLTLLKRSGWLSSVHHWIAISDFMKSQFVRAGISAKDISVIYHSSDLEREPALDDGEEGYVYLGRLSEAKGVDDLLAAWHTLNSQLGNQCPRLQIAGDGPLKSEVMRAAGSNSAIVFRGYLDRPEIDRLVARCKAVIVPTRCWEALGLVVYDAFRSRKAVLCARSGALPEIVKDGYSGVHFQPGMPESLVSAVQQFENFPVGERQRLGANGWEWLARNASTNEWDRRMNAVLGGFIG